MPAAALPSRAYRACTFTGTRDQATQRRMQENLYRPAGQQGDGTPYPTTSGGAAMVEYHEPRPGWARFRSTPGLAGPWIVRDERGAAVELETCRAPRSEGTAIRP